MKRLITLGTLAAAAALSGCGDKDPSCTDGSVRCGDDVLEECVDGTWEVSEDCAAEGMICHDMGDDSHCMLDDSSMEM